MADITLCADDILRADQMALVTRATLTTQRPKRLHTHDFHEVFWVQNGKVRHTTPGVFRDLTEGALVCLSPGQHHGLQARGEAAMVATVALRTDIVTTLASRHPGLAQVFDPEGPRLFWRDIRQLTAINQAALTLERSARDALATEAFLLPLMAELAAMDAVVPNDAPDWLRDACEVARDPNVFREGAAGLARVAGKSHPHVSRAVRQWLGQTPSDYINAIRMDHAARALVTDNEPLAVIAEEIGIPNMSHFHKLFRAQFGLTPLKYRQKLQRGVVQPET